MNLFKSIRDMADMVTAAPDLIESAYSIADMAKATQAAPIAAVPEPTAAALTPIAGVDLPLYVRVSKGVAAYGYDPTKLPAVALAYGVAAADWAVAQVGWATRIQSDSAIGARFNQLFAGV